MTSEIINVSPSAEGTKPLRVQWLTPHISDDAQPAHLGLAPDGAVPVARPPGILRSGVDADRAKELAGIARTHGRTKKKAKALQIEDRAQIGAAGQPRHAEGGVRNALSQIGFIGELRRSEAVAFEVEPVGRTPEGGEIMLPRSKTDQLGEVIFKAIPYSDGLVARQRHCAPGPAPPASRPDRCFGPSASGRQWPAPP